MHRLKKKYQISHSNNSRTNLTLQGGNALMFMYLSSWKGAHESNNIKLKITLTSHLIIDTCSTSCCHMTVWLDICINNQLKFKVSITLGKKSDSERGMAFSLNILESDDLLAFSHTAICRHKTVCKTKYIQWVTVLWEKMMMSEVREE